MPLSTPVGGIAFGADPADTAPQTSDNAVLYGYSFQPIVYQEHFTDGGGKPGQATVTAPASRAPDSGS